MAKRIINTTPRQDGFYMPGEFEPQERVWMLWHALCGRGKWRVFIRRIRCAVLWDSTEMLSAALRDDRRKGAKAESV